MLVLPFSLEACVPNLLLFGNEMTHGFMKWPRFLLKFGWIVSEQLSLANKAGWW